MLDRYAPRRDENILPVAHNDPVTEGSDESAPIAVPEDQETNEPTLAEPMAEPMTERSQAATPESVPPMDANERTSGGVTLQWITPTSVSVGQEVVCQLVVRNASDATAQAVQVEARLPEGVDLGPTEPRAATEGGRVAVGSGRHGAGCDRHRASQLHAA